MNGTPHRRGSCDFISMLSVSVLWLVEGVFKIRSSKQHSLDQRGIKENETSEIKQQEAGYQ